MKTKLVFEVDRAKLFDQLAAMGGSTYSLGNRLVEILLAGEGSFRDALGLGIYGIELTEIEKVPDGK